VSAPPTASTDRPVEVSTSVTPQAIEFDSSDPPRSMERWLGSQYRAWAIEFPSISTPTASPASEIWLTLLNQLLALIRLSCRFAAGWYGVHMAA
jgi:hypothetical protein